MCALLDVWIVQSSSLWQLDVLMSDMLRLCNAFRILLCLFERPNHTSLGRDYRFDWTMADGESLGNTQQWHTDRHKGPCTVITPDWWSELVKVCHLTSDMQDILWNRMHSSLHRFMRIRKISLRCFSLSLAADAWRKKRKPHAYPQQSTNTHADNTHQNNDITYFGGPRLQAVGIATDEESHFPNKRGKLSS